MYFNNLKMGHKCSNYIKIHASLVKKNVTFFVFLGVQWDEKPKVGISVKCSSSLLIREVSCSTIVHVVCFLLISHGTFFFGSKWSNSCRTHHRGFLFFNHGHKTFTSIQWAGGWRSTWQRSKRGRRGGGDLGLRRRMEWDGSRGAPSPNEEVGDYACKRNPNVYLFFIFLTEIKSHPATSVHKFSSFQIQWS